MNGGNCELGIVGEKVDCEDSTARCTNETSCVDLGA